MQNAQREVLATLVGAQEFLDDHAADVADIASNRARKNLDAIVAAVTSHLDAQVGHKMLAQTLTRSGTVAQRALVQDHLGLIAAVARAALPLVPELIIVRSLPEVRTSVGAILTRALDVVKAVTPFADTFIAGGLPADFITQLQGAADALAQLNARRNASIDKRSGATVGISAQLAAGRRHIRILNTQVRAELRDADPSLYAEWKARIALPRTKSGATRRAPVIAPLMPAQNEVVDHHVTAQHKDAEQHVCTMGDGSARKGPHDVVLHETSRVRLAASTPPECLLPRGQHAADIGGHRDHGPRNTGHVEPEERGVPEHEQTAEYNDERERAVKERNDSGERPVQHLRQVWSGEGGHSDQRYSLHTRSGPLPSPTASAGFHERRPPLPRVRARRIEAR